MEYSAIQKIVAVLEEDVAEHAPTRNRPDKGLCTVCAAPASGYNFRVLTCESCKAFFRRNALKNMPTCKMGGLCEINPGERKCRACRLLKCRSVGMKADRIQAFDKISKRKNARVKKARGQPVTTPNAQNAFMALCLSGMLGMVNPEMMAGFVPSSSSSSSQSGTATESPGGSGEVELDPDDSLSDEEEDYVVEGEEEEGPLDLSMKSGKT